jgi:hypothetical protein
MAGRLGGLRQRPGSGPSAAPRSGAPGLPGDFFRTGIVAQRESHRIKIPAWAKRRAARATMVWPKPGIFICARWLAAGAPERRKEAPNSRGVA